MCMNLGETASLRLQILILTTVLHCVIIVTRVLDCVVKMKISPASTEGEFKSEVQRIGLHLIWKHASG